jgi:hypothetical protein
MSGLPQIWRSISAAEKSRTTAAGTIEKTPPLTAAICASHSSSRAVSARVMYSSQSPNLPGGEMRQDPAALDFDVAAVGDEVQLPPVT